MWQFSLITNAIFLSKKKSSTPEEKERRQRQLEYEAQEWQKAKAYNRTWKGFLHRMIQWACGSFVFAMLVDMLGATSPDQLQPDSLLSLVIYAYRSLIHEAYQFFAFDPRHLFFCAFSYFFLIEIPRQVVYAIERHKAPHQQPSAMS